MPVSVSALRELAFQRRSRVGDCRYRIGYFISMMSARIQALKKIKQRCMKSKDRRYSRVGGWQRPRSEDDHLAEI